MISVVACREPLESWRPVPGFPGYEVSDAGRVRSYLGKGHSKPRFDSAPRLLSNKKNRRGYMRVNLASPAGRIVTREVHRLVLEAFVGPREDLQTLHANGARHDNRLENLRWGTALENSADAIAHGTMARGSRHWRAKLTEEDVANILRSRGVKPSKIARAYGVSPDTVYAILSGRCWRHVSASVAATPSESHLHPRTVIAS